jgi:hypothetical protein
MVINAKGGSGATALAVNLATALQQNHGQTVLVDLAPGGHTALHLNVRASLFRKLHQLSSGVIYSTNGAIVSIWRDEVSLPSGSLIATIPAYSHAFPTRWPDCLPLPNTSQDWRRWDGSRL